MPATIMDGKAVAARMMAELSADAAAFQQVTGTVPHLAAVLVGENPASAVYVRNKQTACEKAGLKSSLHRLPAETTEAQLLELVERLNADSTVHGILVQLPLPKQIREQVILDAVVAHKDVDCFHPHNVGLLVQGRPRFLPCTPAGCQRLLAEYDIPTTGAHAVVLGRSEIVGKPMALLLVQRGAVADATVTICHSRTRDLATIVRQADIVIAAIGKARFVTADMIKPGAVVLDVGINREGDKLVGDVDFEPVSQVASAITPVPGGVGPMTIALLLRNTLTAAQLSVGYV
ncbi:MAG TPA: bifunctional 5,10-methylenetetrahydrofolate dehydrogenase/5,10-methenyltetrahydrofolate cyclohydrolase [Planctomycetaceae bacterium]|nr:bifunctional 5,10-methylenetetrahydrofolate dehydrogenase/5,10-methenyltetrahydrofolate cyclohydrolase [Planctomycetaceae bacterium]